MITKVKAYPIYKTPHGTMVLLGLHAHKPRFWSMLGGNVERGEMYTDALEREIDEETDGYVWDFKIIETLPPLETTRAIIYPIVIELNTDYHGLRVNTSEFIRVDLFTEKEITDLLNNKSVGGYELWWMDKKIIRHVLKHI